MLRVCGLNARERVLFLTAVMQYGPPFVHQATEEGWVVFDKLLAGKTRLEVRRSQDWHCLFTHTLGCVQKMKL